MNRPFRDLGKISDGGAQQIALVPSLERRRLRAYLGLLVSDCLAIYASFALAGLLYHGELFEWRAMIQAHLVLPIYYTIALYNRTYCARALTEWRFAISKALVALLISAALLNFVAFYLKSNAAFLRVTFTLGLLLSFTLIILLRKIATALVGRYWHGKVQNYLVLEDGGPNFALQGARIVSAKTLSIDTSQQDLQMLNRLGQLLHNQDKVVVSCSAEKRVSWARVLKAIGVHGEVVSHGAHELGAIDVVRYGECARSTLVVSTGPLRMRERIIKRSYDLGVAGVGLLFLSPAMLLIAIAVKLEDRGKVFFVQKRLGRGNRFFDMVKFRTMKVAEEDRAGDRSASPEDERITTIGRFLRSTSLDELPQLWNVLKGEMSIVGPRPHAPGSRANEKLFWEISSDYWRRHSLKPGLTGLAQVRGHRGATENERHLTDRLSSDLEYIRGWSLWRDVTITLKTLSVISHERAF